MRSFLVSRFANKKRPAGITAQDSGRRVDLKYIHRHKITGTAFTRQDVLLAFITTLSLPLNTPAKYMPSCRVNNMPDAPCAKYEVPHSPEFILDVPPQFVQLPRSGRAASNYLLVSGDFRTGSTLTVESLDLQRLLPGGFASELPAGSSDADALISALLRHRDSQSGVDIPSKLLPSFDSLEGPGFSEATLTPCDFLFSTPLVFPAKPADPEFERITIARALLLVPPSGDIRDAHTRVLILWGGAKRSEWDNGMGQVMRAAASSFRLRK
mmetsp:Transcript_30829/g.51004  ORF Transcript_30829/g.51004 Transcript_30829/m.51004 type:complete len:269 (+) Transcript_30829:206-1012(+)